MIRPIARRLIVSGLLAAPLGARRVAAEATSASVWSPTHAVRVVIAYPPAGASDIAGRWLARKLAPRLGQPVVVENRPGANGIIGTQHVAASAPDGHTLMVTTADTHAVNPAVYRRLPYNAQDFVPVAPFARLVFALVARRGLGIRDVGGFIDVARRSVLPLTYSSWGIASTSQIMMETFGAGHDLRLQHVPFQGSASALAAVAAGQVDCMMAPVGLAIAQDARLTPLGVVAGARFPAAPECPTLNEQGFPLTGDLWVALLAPPGTPIGVAERVAAEVHAIVATQEATAFLIATGLVPDVQDRPSFLVYLREDAAVWQARVERLGIRIDA
ncbi:Bug family tripartite tricarboxylate transporter substrate binding protein [Falsiroseomonas sp. HW251]|uniref:Bug family tripartite tricarboxylate transporter substrate binding protein n=1 Tax=Falsiroseomonas sp. HW251 TaxID=3390998 RepID=UPI003D310F41